MQQAQTFKLCNGFPLIPDAQMPILGYLLATGSLVNSISNLFLESIVSNPDLKLLILDLEISFDNGFEIIFKGYTVLKFRSILGYIKYNDRTLYYSNS